MHLRQFWDMKYCFFNGSSLWFFEYVSPETCHQCCLSDFPKWPCSHPSRPPARAPCRALGSPLSAVILRQMQSQLQWVCLRWCNLAAQITSCIIETVSKWLFCRLKFTHWNMFRSVGRLKLVTFDWFNLDYIGYHSIKRVLKFLWICSCFHACPSFW